MPCDIILDAQHNGTQIQLNTVRLPLTSLHPVRHESVHPTHPNLDASHPHHYAKLKDNVQASVVS